MVILSLLILDLLHKYTCKISTFMYFRLPSPVSETAAVVAYPSLVRRGPQSALPLRDSACTCLHTPQHIAISCFPGCPERVCFWSTPGFSLKHLYILL